MRDNVRDWIMEAITETEIEASILSDRELARLFDRVRTQFVPTFGVERWPWSTAESTAACPWGWDHLCDYCGERPILLEYDLDYTHGMLVANGDQLRELLGEMPNFEFWVVDEAVTYAMCHSHHDDLLGWGRAVPWVDAIRAMHVDGQPCQSPSEERFDSSH